MKDIYVYATINSWIDESPEVTIKGMVNSKNMNYIEIVDENGYTQLINIDKVFAVVY